MLSRQEGSTTRHLGSALVLWTGQPVETQDVFFRCLVGRSAPTGLANCPLDRVLTYKNLVYLLNFQFYCTTIAYHVGLNAVLRWPQGIRPTSKKNRHL